MNSLTYLLYCGTKNRFLEIIKTPAKLIPYLLGIGFLLFILISSLGVEVPDFAPAPEHDMHLIDVNVAVPNLTLLQGIFFGFFALTFFTTSFAGLKGTSQYGMEDVNFLFVSPIRARTILLYGIIRSFKPIIFGSWFVVFQASWLRGGYGVGIGGIFLLWLAYVLFTLSCQMLSIFLYAMTNGNAKRIFGAKIILVLAFLPAIVAFLLHLFNLDWNLIAGLSALLESPIADFTPLVGWAATGTVALIMGETVTAVVFLGLVTAFMIILIVIVYVKDPDFYEHVAGATQTAFETTRAAQEGDIQSIYASNEKARVKGTGLNRGEGANTFLFKHIRESFRAKRFGLWGLPTLFYIVGAGIFAFVSRSGSYTEEGYYIASMSEWVILTILSTMLFIGFFSTSLGRGSLETFSHYIYMIPESPLKKWLWANSETIFKITVEGVLIFGVSGLIFGRAPLSFAIAAVVYITFSFYSLGTSLAFLRITGIASKSVILSVLMLVLYIAPLLPGLTVAIIAGVVVGGSAGLPIGMLIFAFWQTGVGLICFA
jgi:hypothetical protein